MAYLVSASAGSRYCCRLSPISWPNNSININRWNHDQWINIFMNPQLTLYGHIYTLTAGRVPNTIAFQINLQVSFCSEPLSKSG